MDAVLYKAQCKNLIKREFERNFEGCAHFNKLCGKTNNCRIILQTLIDNLDL